MHCFVSIVVFAIILKRKRNLVALFCILQMYCYYKCSVALPRVAAGWSAVCDYGISKSYSLTFYTTFYQFGTVCLDYQDIQRQKYINIMKILPVSS